LAGAIGASRQEQIWRLPQGTSAETLLDAMMISTVGRPPAA
jgi:hypothetical protein